MAPLALVAIFFFALLASYPAISQVTLKKNAEPASDITTLNEQQKISKTALLELAKKQASAEKSSKELALEIKQLATDDKKIRAQLIKTVKNKKKNHTNIRKIEDQILKLQQDELFTRQNLLEKKDVLIEVLAALQRMGRNPPPALLIKPGDALSSVRSAILLGAVVPKLRNETDIILKHLTRLASLKTSILDQKTALLDALIVNEQDERRMKLLLSEKSKLKENKRSKLNEIKKLSETLAGKSVDLRGLISKLENQIITAKEAKKRAEEEKLRREKESKEQREIARLKLEELRKKGNLNQNRIVPAFAFSDLKNTLEFPVSGRIINQFGDDDGTGRPLSGLVMEANAGEFVTAPADGWLIYAGKFRSYGQLVILNTGDDYHIVLAGMDRLIADPGQFIISGEPIGVMGTTRLAATGIFPLAPNSPTLYIEFRKDSKPIDSLPWWAGYKDKKERK